MKKSFTCLSLVAIIRLANTAGEFLLGCVWYEFLFEKDIRTSTYTPANLTLEDATILREIAHASIGSACRAPAITQ